MIKQMEMLEFRMQGKLYFNTVAIGKSINCKAKNSNIIKFGRYFYIIKILSIKAKMKDIFNKSMFIEALESELGNEVGINRNIKHYYKYSMEYFVNEFVGVELYKKSIEDFLMENDIRKIFMPSDSHAISRLICMISKKYEVKTYVLQHGSIGELAFSPIYADYFLGWGKQCKEFFKCIGENCDNVYSVGNVKYSQIHYRDNCYTNFKVERILWAVNPIGDSVNMDLFNLLEKYIIKNKGIRLEIKLHPGNSNKLFYVNLVKRSCCRDRIEIIDNKSDIIEMIEKSDIVVITQSTTGLEAMMLKKVVCLYDVESIPNIIDYTSFNSVINFSDGSELEYKLNNISEETIVKLNINAQSLLSHYMKPFDENKFVELVEGNI